MYEIVIRPALAAEADQISHLAVSSKAIWGYGHDFMNVCREVLRLSPKMIEEQPCFVCCEKDEIRGFYLLEIKGDICELDMLFVMPGFIGQGVGKALLQHAQTKAVELGCVKMSVTSDPQALPFYEGQGGQMSGWEKSEVLENRLLPRLDFLL